MSRTGRVDTTTDIQLRLLPSSDYFDFPSVHCLLCSEIVLARPCSWTCVFCHWVFCLQVPVALCHGSSTTLYWQRMDHHCRQNCGRTDDLSIHHGWSARSSWCCQEISWNCSTRRDDNVVQCCFQPKLYSADDLYCSQVNQESRTWKWRRCCYSGAIHFRSNCRRVERERFEIHQPKSHHTVSLSA
jgi:hypothetical protein